MTSAPLHEGATCPTCSAGGTLRLAITSEADRIDGRTVVVHEIPTYVCDRCGIELCDEATTRTLESFYDHVAHESAQTYVSEFYDIHPVAATI